MVHLKLFFMEKNISKKSKNLNFGSKYLFWWILPKIIKIPKPDQQPIFRFSPKFSKSPNLTNSQFFEFRQKISSKISEFDDRDMIQTQVEKIIDVDEKNGKSDGVL